MLLILLSAIIYYTHFIKTFVIYMSYYVTNAALKQNAGEVTLVKLLSQLPVIEKESEIIILMYSCSVMLMSK